MVKLHSKRYLRTLTTKNHWESIPIFKGTKHSMYYFSFFSKAILENFTRKTNENETTETAGHVFKDQSENSIW